MLSGMTTDGQDCILVHHTGCTSKARYKDPFTSCHVNFAPLEGASLVRLTCQAISHLTDGMSTLINTGYYPKNFPTALRKCTWPHERLPARRPDRLTFCNETQELYEGLHSERLLADDSQCGKEGAGIRCMASDCTKTGGTAGNGCGCEGNCCPSGTNIGEPCKCTPVGVAADGKSVVTTAVARKVPPKDADASRQALPGSRWQGFHLSTVTYA
eukprot:SM000288S10779  [mRNA]  locus=s288:79157:81507:+ [translate_table: standard]